MANWAIVDIFVSTIWRWWCSKFKTLMLNKILKTQDSITTYFYNKSIVTIIIWERMRNRGREREITDNWQIHLQSHKLKEFKTIHVRHAHITDNHIKTVPILSEHSKCFCRFSISCYCKNSISLQFRFLEDQTCFSNNHQ